MSWDEENIQCAKLAKKNEYKKAEKLRIAKDEVVASSPVSWQQQFVVTTRCNDAIVELFNRDLTLHPLYLGNG